MRGSRGAAAAWASCLFLLGGAAGCGDNTPASSPKAPATNVDPVTGQALSSFKGDPTYPWRVNLAKKQDDYLAAMARIEPGWKSSLSLARGLNICEILTLGYGETDVLTYVSSQFQQTAKPTPRADAKQALDVVHGSICPDLPLPGH